MTYGSFWRLIHQTGGPTFVIKQKKLLHRVNIGGLIETDTAAVENWTVNHRIPASLATVGGSYWCWQLVSVVFTFISFFSTFAKILMTVDLFLFQTCQCCVLLSTHEAAVANTLSPTGQLL